jgi:hypothetical protein
MDWTTRLKMHSVLYPRTKCRQDRLSAITGLHCQDYKAKNFCRHFMGAARLQWQVLKLHGCARRCPAAVAVSQTAKKCPAQATAKSSKVAW